jgi:hypothetical protein
VTTVKRGGIFPPLFLSAIFCSLYVAIMTDLSLTSDIEFALVHFNLEFQEHCKISQSDFLRLRRELWAVADHALGDRTSERFRLLFDPPLPDDPVALRRFQRPGPPFALLPELWREKHFDAGDRLEIAASFWGRGVHALADFARVLQSVGKVGFHRRQGVFELVAIEAEDAGGNRSLIWREGEGLHHLAPPINEVGWWLSRQGEPTAVLLEFLTPARLMSKGRPLFQIDFRRLFPFLLRRVTGMLYAHCGREIIADPGQLLAAAVNVRETENCFCWHDWRTIEGEGTAQDLGGVSGSVRLEGENFQDVFAILRIGSLMNVGKGAAFGAGHFLLRELGTC